jgi:hypothetical protein
MVIIRVQLFCSETAGHISLFDPKYLLRKMYTKRPSLPRVVSLVLVLAIEVWTTSDAYHLHSLCD